MTTQDNQTRYIQAIYYHLERALADYRAKEVMAQDHGVLNKWNYVVRALETFKDEISIQEFMDDLKKDNQ